MDQAAIKVAWRREGKEEEKVFSILPTADALWKFIFHAPVIPYIGQIVKSVLKNLRLDITSKLLLTIHSNFEIINDKLLYLESE